MMSFIPTVIKAASDGEEGYLVSYKDLCQALHIPKEYWLTRIRDCGRAVELSLAPKADISCSRGIVRYRKKDYGLALRDRALFTEVLGIDFDHFDAKICRRMDSHTYRWLLEFPSPDAFLHPDEIFVRFDKDEMFSIEGGGIFTPEKSMIKKTY